MEFIKDIFAVIGFATVAFTIYAYVSASIMEARERANETESERDHRLNAERYAQFR